jgi:hypothetical protein
MDRNDKHEIFDFLWLMGTMVAWVNLIGDCMVKIAELIGWFLYYVF